MKEKKAAKPQKEPAPRPRVRPVDKTAEVSKILDEAIVVKKENKRVKEQMDGLIKDNQELMAKMKAAAESFENLVQGLNGKLGDIVNIQADAQENPLGAVQGIAKEGLQAIEKWSHSGFLKVKNASSPATTAPGSGPAAATKQATPETPPKPEPATAKKE